MKQQKQDRDKELIEKFEKMINELEEKFLSQKCDEESCSACCHSHAMWIAKQDLNKLKE